MTTLMNQSQPPGGGGFKICDLGALVVAWPVRELSAVPPTPMRQLGSGRWRSK